MAYCEKCGTKAEEGQRYCPFCGAPIPEGQKEPWDGKDRQYHSGTFSGEDVGQHKVMAVLAYLGILVFVPLFAGDKSSPYLRHHTNQGFLLWIAGLFCRILSGHGVFGLFTFHVWPLYIVGELMSLVVFVLCIVGIVDACRGVERDLPFVGTIHIL